VDPDVENVIRIQAVDGATLQACHDAHVTGIRQVRDGAWLVDMKGTRWGQPVRLQAVVQQQPSDPAAIECTSCVVVG
jgi:hypothetical protein